jgi:anti-anti-sigma factor
MSSKCTHRFFSATEQDSTGVVAATAPDLGVTVIDDFSEQLLSLAEERGWSSVALDLQKVDFLGAAALGAFVALNKVLRARGGGLTIRGVSGPLFDVFQVAHLERLFDLRRRNEPYRAPPGRACLWPRLRPCSNR